MAVFTTPFTVPANYTYDSNKIFVSGGVAGLKENLTNIYGRWHLNESSGILAPDDSGNGRDGTLLNMEDADWVSAKLNNGLAFDGTNESVNLGDIANFGQTTPFSVECWFSTTSTAAMTFLSRMQTSGPSRGWLFYIQAGNVRFTHRRSTPANEAWVRTVSTFHDGAFHHAIITYDGSSDTSGIKIYIDGVSQTLVVDSNTLSGSTLNVGVASIGSRNNTNLYFLGTLDECAIYDRVLTQNEVTFRHNAGIGRENFIYHADSPTIYKTAGNSGTISSFTNFTVTDGVTEGSKGYQLSEDGIIWKYWSGSAWIVAGAMDYNTAAVVNTNIITFPSVANKIYVKTFLISDSFQREEIDELQITYSENTNPTVDAGSNKEVFDNLFLAMFSDANFFDVDGTVDHAYYKVDGEVDTWTEILQGGYATLLEAVQAFTYQFINTGTLIVRLQAQDNVGGTNEDSLQVIVKKYTKIVNVKDVVTEEHIINFDFNPGDGSGTIQRDSPFNWSWDYGNFDITLEKFFYYTKQQTIFVENENELTLFMQASAFLNQCIGTADLLTEGDTLSVMAWLQQGGELITNPTSCNVKLYDQNDILRYDETTSVHDEGHFLFNKTPSGLPNEGLYHLSITIVASGVSFISVVPIGLIERKLISFEGVIHLDVDNGVPGIVFPQGTPQHAVNNWSDAKAIAEANNIDTILVIGTLVLTETDDISGFTFKGHHPEIARIELNDGPAQKAVFDTIEIVGQINGFIHVDHCHIREVTGLRGHIHNALLIGPITLGGGEETIMSFCYSGIPGFETPTIDMGGAGQVLQMRGVLGGLFLKNKTGSESASIDYLSGQFLVDASCIAGTIVVRGGCDNYVDNSGAGCTVSRPLLQDVHDEAIGKWTLDPVTNTLTLYRKDGTILTVMDLPFTLDTLPAYVGRIPR